MDIKKQIKSINKIIEIKKLYYDELKKTDNNIKNKLKNIFKNDSELINNNNKINNNKINYEIELKYLENLDLDLNLKKINNLYKNMKIIKELLKIYLNKYEKKNIKIENNENKNIIIKIHEKHNIIDNRLKCECGCFIKFRDYTKMIIHILKLSIYVIDKIINMDFEDDINYELKEKSILKNDNKLILKYNIMKKYVYFLKNKILKIKKINKILKNKNKINDTPIFIILNIYLYLINKTKEYNSIEIIKLKKIIIEKLLNIFIIIKKEKKIIKEIIKYIKMNKNNMLFKNKILEIKENYYNLWTLDESFATK